MGRRRDRHLPGAVGNSGSLSTELLEGRDFYWEDGLMVMTAEYLRRRGYCCESGCRYCPYTTTSK